MNTNISRKLLGFTLIELLVIIAVIGSSVALLLPVLVKAQQKALGVQCLSNQRQLSLGWEMYTDDNRGKLLFARPPIETSLTQEETCWLPFKIDETKINHFSEEATIKKSPLPLRPLRCIRPGKRLMADRQVL